MLFLWMVFVDRLDAFQHKAFHRLRKGKLFRRRVLDNGAARGGVHVFNVCLCGHILFQHGFAQMLIIFAFQKRISCV